MKARRETIIHRYVEKTARRKSRKKEETLASLQIQIGGHFQHVPPGMV